MAETTARGESNGASDVQALLYGHDPLPGIVAVEPGRPRRRHALPAAGTYRPSPACSAYPH